MPEFTGVANPIEMMLSLLVNPPGENWIQP